MKGWGLSDGVRNFGIFGSWEEIERELHRLRASSETSRIYTLGPIDEDHFVEFGLSPQMCFLEFHPFLGAPQTYVAYEPSSEPTDTCWFDYAGTPTEIPRTMCITYATLLKALQEYVETGKQPTSVAWIEPNAGEPTNET